MKPSKFNKVYREFIQEFKEKFPAGRQETFPAGTILDPRGKPLQRKQTTVPWWQKGFGAAKSGIEKGWDVARKAHGGVQAGIKDLTQRPSTGVKALAALGGVELSTANEYQFSPVSIDNVLAYIQRGNLDKTGNYHQIDITSQINAKNFYEQLKLDDPQIADEVYDAWEKLSYGTSSKPLTISDPDHEYDVKIRKAGTSILAYVPVPKNP